MVRVKICGITNFEDAYAAFKYGADAIGFVFYPESPRYIKPEDAREISFKLPPFIAKIGVFVNSTFEEVMSIAKLVNLCGVQLHGEETPFDVMRIKPFYPVIKAFPIEKAQDVGKFLEYTEAIPLFDSKTALRGGSGRSFSWELIKDVSKAIDFFIVAGGINEDNVGELMDMLNPPMIDVSSGVEIEPGRKDHEKLKRFLYKVKRIKL